MHRTLLHFTVTIVAMSSFLLTGCGPNCQNTCQLIFDESECGIKKPGLNADEMINDCVTECEDALQHAGTTGDYDPSHRYNSAQQGSASLENEAQAAAWMNCVWEMAPEATNEQCQNLDPSVGYCAPI